MAFVFFLTLLCILQKNLIKYVCCVVYVQLLILPAVFPQQSCTSKYLLKTFIYHLSIRNKKFSGPNMKDYIKYVRPFIHHKHDSELQQFKISYLLVISLIFFNCIFIFQPNISHSILVCYHIIYQLKSCQKKMLFYMIGPMFMC